MAKKKPVSKPEPTQETELQAQYFNLESLAKELHFLNNPESQNDGTFQRRLSNMYAYAFIQQDKNLYSFLELRFGNLQLADKNIIINIIEDKD
jgi:hypothetical protein